MSFDTDLHSANPAILVNAFEVIFITVMLIDIFLDDERET